MGKVRVSGCESEPTGRESRDATTTSLPDQVKASDACDSWWMMLGRRVAWLALSKPLMAALIPPALRENHLPAACKKVGKYLPGKQARTWERRFHLLRLLSYRLRFTKNACMIKCFGRSLRVSKMEYSKLIYMYVRSPLGSRWSKLCVCPRVSMNHDAGQTAKRWMLRLI
jgi:hypothetical protein